MGSGKPPSQYCHLLCPLPQHLVSVKVMDEPLYDQLRTKEQLGYSVGGSARVTCGVLGFCITVQSAAYGPAHLYARVRAFIKSFRDTLVRCEVVRYMCHFIKKTLPPVKI